VNSAAGNANLATLKAAYARWQDTKGGSVAHWMAMMADDIRFASLAAGPPQATYLTTYERKAALLVYFEGLARDWTMIHYTIDEYVVDGDVVVARGHCAFRNKKTGKAFATPKMDYWRFRDGKIVEYFEYYDTAAVLAAATA
jgi:ketosteroid isomerase-like protein